MVVLSIEHSVPKIRGTITKYMMEIKPNLFVGNISKKIRDYLWNSIKENSDNNTNSVMIYNYPNEQGFKIEVYGNPKRNIISFDGIELIAQKIDESDYVLNLWGKLNPYKSLLQHMLETGYTLEILLRESMFSEYLDVLLENSTMKNREEMIAACCYLACMHDIGKAHPAFQYQYTDIILPSKFKTLNSIDGFRHEEYSKEIFFSLWSKTDLFKSYKEKKVLKILSNILCVHHQGKTPNTETRISPLAAEDEWKKLHHVINQKISEEYSFSFFQITENINGFCELLSGLIILSDWIASSNILDDVSFDENHKINTQKIIKKHIIDGKINQNYNPYPFCPYDYFPFLEKCGMRDLQKTICDIPLKDILCLMIEAPMGAGKTEAGLLAALKMGVKKSGIYIALPTYATSKAMQPRLQEMLNSAKLDFNINLLSGLSWLDGDDDKRIWSQEGRMKLFYPYSVGTIDQILSAEKLIKYNILRLLASGTKSIILDEVHAYDAYMMGILIPLLHWYKFLNVPVVIQSATLPLEIKRKICQIYSKEKLNNNFAYPSITSVSKNGIINQYAIKNNSNKKYNIVLKSYKEYFQIADLGMEKVKNGGCCCIIMNTVDGARKIFSEITERMSDNVFLLHARNTYHNKEKITEEILKLFGKDRSNRPGKAIVVSTQILEQSIDVDFDYMISEICPIDLLLQRSGRLHRHDDKETIRELSPFIPELTVFYSNKQQKVYYQSLINRTLDVLQHQSQFNIPSDIPSLVNTVYDIQTTNELEMKWKNDEEWKEALAMHYTIGFPADNQFVLYNDKNNISSAESSTRYSEYETINIALVDDLKDMDIIFNDKQSSSAFYKEKVVNIPEYLLGNNFFHIHEKGVDYIYGEKWLKNVLICNCKEFVIDDIYGFLVLNENPSNMA